MPPGMLDISPDFAVARDKLEMLESPAEYVGDSATMK